MPIIYARSSSVKKKKTKKERDLAEQWDKLLKQFPPMRASKSSGTIKETKAYVRETPYYPSVNSGGYNATAKPTNVYTGTKMIGIGTMHKSNSVPVFSDDEAKEIATMRRN
jgi:hypothetical protein